MRTARRIYANGPDYYFRLRAGVALRTSAYALRPCLRPDHIMAQAGYSNDCVTLVQSEFAAHQRRIVGEILLDSFHHSFSDFALIASATQFALLGWIGQKRRFNQD